MLDALCGSFITEALAEERDASQAATATTYRQQLLDLAQGDDAAQEAQDIWNGLIADYPDHFHITHAVGCVGTHLAKIWNGHVSLTDIWPSQISPPALLRQVLGTELSSRIGISLRSQLTDAIRTLPEGRRLRVAEISAGPPALASMLCKFLDFDRADYSFFGGDVGGLDEARRLLERFPSIELKPLDDASPVGNRQLVVVTLDFASLARHCTRSTWPARCWRLRAR